MSFFTGIAVSLGSSISLGFPALMTGHALTPWYYRASQTVSTPIGSSERDLFACYTFTTIEKWRLNASD